MNPSQRFACGIILPSSFCLRFRIRGEITIIPIILVAVR